ncbi:MAG: hypothetical protein AB7S36_17665, partial [Planctomycetota bacterium]
MDYRIAIDAAPLLAALELIVGARLLLTRAPQSSPRSLATRDRRIVGGGFVATAALWALTAILLRNGDSTMLAALIPWLGVVALGVAVIFWRRRPMQVTGALQNLTDPARLEQLPSDMRPLVGRVRALARRITMVGTLDATLRALFIGAVVAAIWLLVDRVLTDTTTDLLTGLLAAPVLALAGGVAAGLLLSGATPVEAAVRADIVLNLRERLSTALAINGQTEFEVAVRRDAVDQLRNAQWAEVAPMRMPWQGPATLAVGALLVAGALWLPTWRLLDQTAKQPPSTSQMRSNAGKALDILTTNRHEFNELADAIGTKEMKSLVDQINRVIEELQQRPNPNDAMSELRQKELIQKLSDLEDQADQLRKQLEALGKDAETMKQQRDQNGESGPKDPADTLKDKLSQQDYEGSADALKDMQKQMDKADKGDGQA